MHVEMNLINKLSVLSAHLSYNGDAETEITETLEEMYEFSFRNKRV